MTVTLVAGRKRTPASVSTAFPGAEALQDETSAYLFDADNDYLVVEYASDDVRDATTVVAAARNQALQDDNSDDLLDDALTSLLAEYTGFPRTATLLPA